MSKQTSFFKSPTEFGGDLGVGKAKARRPLSTRKPLHIVMRSSKAEGSMSLLKQKSEIERVLEKQADRWQIRVYQYSVNSNHIHLAILGRSRASLQGFFRSFAGLVARLMTKAERGRPFGKWWDCILWTRLVEWGKAFHTVRNYIIQNVLESVGLIPYERRKGGRHGKTVLLV